MYITDCIWYWPPHRALHQSLVLTVYFTGPGIEPTRSSGPSAVRLAHLSYGHLVSTGPSGISGCAEGTSGISGVLHVLLIHLVNLKR